MIHNRHAQWSPRPFRLLAIALAALSASAQTNPPCSICGTGGTVGARDEPIIDPLTQQNTTCGALDDLGLAGQFNALQCPVVQLYVENADACACSGGPTSAPATSAPSLAPVATATGTPTSAPVATATSAPTLAPTSAATTSAPSAAGTATQAPVVATTAPAAAAPTVAPAAGPTTLPATPTAAPSVATAPSIAPAQVTSAPAAATPSAAPAAAAPSVAPAAATPSVAPAAAAPSAVPAAPTQAPTAASPALSGGAIAGIVIGVLVFIAILVAAVAYDMCGNRKSQLPVQVPPNYYDPEPSPAAARTSSSTPPAQPSAAAAGAVGVAGGAAAVAAAGSSDAVPKDSPSDAPSDFDSSQPSLAMTGGSLVEGDEGASYAYSLDAGNVTATGGGTDAASVMTGASAGTFATTSRKFKKTVVAPAGRLGIVIDTTLEGPVVHTVKPDSPLKGVLFVGDIIVAIDDVDTKAMTATSITSLMVKTAAQERTLTILSNDPKR